MTPEYNTVPQVECLWETYNLSEAFTIYIVHIYKVMYICTGISVQSYYPNSTFLILLFVGIMLFCRFIETCFISEMAAIIQIVRYNR